MPKVFIIILNWNGYQDTKECIESLEKNDYSDFKIVVIDNGSTDESLDSIPRQYRNISFIETKKNLGFAGGNNIGINYALEYGADYILLLNNDTTVESDFLGRLVEVGENDKKNGILGPMILSYDDREKIWFAGGKFNWARTRGVHPGYGDNSPHPSLYKREGAPPLILRGGWEELKEVDYITGCCLLIKREVIEKIGLLSEDYFLYYEDGDWCLRAKKAGWQSVLVPQAKIYHKQSKSAHEGSYPYIYYHARNGLLLCSRFRSKFLAHIIGAWIFLKQIIKLAVGYRKNWTRPIIKGIIDFWKGKKGKLEGYY